MQKKKILSHTTLRRTKPTHVYGVCSCPCESFASEMRNKAVASLEAGDVGVIVYRYIQSRAFRKRSEFSAKANFFVPIVGLLFTIPETRNSRRYNKTEKACLEFLSRYFSEQVLQELKDTLYDNGPIRSFLMKHGISTEELDKILGRKNQLKSYHNQRYEPLENPLAFF